jgi:hypothetical protein
MANRTTKKKPSGTNQRDRYYEQTVVRPASRLIAAIEKKANAANPAAR